MDSLLFQQAAIAAQQQQTQQQQNIVAAQRALNPDDYQRLLRLNSSGGGAGNMDFGKILTVNPQNYDLQLKTDLLVNYQQQQNRQNFAIAAAQLVAASQNSSIQPQILTISDSFSTSSFMINSKHSNSKLLNF